MTVDEVLRSDRVFAWFDDSFEVEAVTPVRLVGTCQIEVRNDAGETYIVFLSCVRRSAGEAHRAAAAQVAEEVAKVQKRTWALSRAALLLSAAASRAGHATPPTAEPVGATQ